jgi:hypothetical protein
LGEKNEERDYSTDLGEEFTVPDIKRELTIFRNRQRPAQNAFSKGAAFGILQHLRDATELVHETGHPRVRGPGHWPTGFDTAENRIFEMLI